MIPMKKAVIALSCLSILLMACSSLLNPSIQNSLKEVRTSKFLKNEDKTKTIGGIDANSNGVRDDIEGYIKLKYGNNPEFVSVYMQYAQELRRKLTLLVMIVRPIVERHTKLVEKWFVLRKLTIKLSLKKCIGTQ